MRLGVPELLVILFIVILIFGANRLPELGKGIGQGDQELQGRDERTGERQDWQLGPVPTGERPAPRHPATESPDDSPTRRVTRSRSSHSSSGIAYFRLKPIAFLERRDIDRRRYAGRSGVPPSARTSGFERRERVRDEDTARRADERVARARASARAPDRSAAGRDREPSRQAPRGPAASARPPGDASSEAIPGRASSGDDRRAMRRERERDRFRAIGAARCEAVDHASKSSRAPCGATRSRSASRGMPASRRLRAVKRGQRARATPCVDRSAAPLASNSRCAARTTRLTGGDELVDRSAASAAGPRPPRRTSVCDVESARPGFAPARRPSAVAASVEPR